jgi:hypothetical protein
MMDSEVGTPRLPDWVPNAERRTPNAERRMQNSTPLAATPRDYILAIAP